LGDAEIDMKTAMAIGMYPVGAVALPMSFWQAAHGQLFNIHRNYWR
jgi:hypothetical protein